MRFLRIMETQFLNAQRQGKISFYGGATGQEASVLGSGMALEPGDICVPALREGAIALYRGYPFMDYVNQIFGNANDRTLGRQMPCHYSDKPTGHFSLSSPVANQLPQAVGMAHAERLKGSDRVVMAFLGDGGTAEADFHIAMNFASLWKAPVVFVCQNNQWAISTPVESQMATATIEEKAVAWNIPSVRVDGNDVFAVHDACTEAIRRARKGYGPSFVEALTYRVGAHTTSDDPSRYRDESVTKRWIEEFDPIIRLRQYLMDRRYVTDQGDESMDQDFLHYVKDCISKAEKTEPPPLFTLFTDVYARMPNHLVQQSVRMGISAQADATIHPEGAPRTREPWDVPPNSVNSAP